MINKEKITNKSKLTKAVATRLSVEESDAQEMVDTVLDEIVRALLRSQDVLITGFGTFRVEEMGPRRAYDMHKNEEIQLPARATVKFRPGTRLLEYVRGERDTPDTGKIIGKSSPDRGKSN